MLKTVMSPEPLAPLGVKVMTPLSPLLNACPLEGSNFEGPSATLLQMWQSPTARLGGRRPGWPPLSLCTQLATGGLG